MSINRVNISGNMTRDPELRSLQNGTAVLSFGVAVNDRRRNQQTGEWEDYANFVDCTLFGNRAQSLSNILHKGMKVAIEGRLHYSSWQTQDGQKRSKIEVFVDEIEFMSAREQGQQGYQQQQYQGQTYGQGYQQQPQQQFSPQAQYAQQQYQQTRQQVPQPPAPPQPAPQPPMPPQQPVQTQMQMPQTPQQQAATQAAQAYQGQQQPPAQDVFDEDIPF